MRLTLRSLLAYLDDVLDPATLKEMGTRVSESAPAAAIVARIKEVVRRRRIAAPELTGSGSAPDPNIVAEYLDNTLAPEAVPGLEKLYLDSDMHLAEVASSHQILTAVLGEPVDVPVTTRERMYALVSTAPLVAEDSKSKIGFAGHGESVPPATSVKAAMRPITPDYLQPSAGRKLVLGFLGMCLAVGWMCWVLKDQGIWPSIGGQPVVTVDQPRVKIEATPPAHTAEKAHTAVKGKASESPPALANEPVDPDITPDSVSALPSEENALAANSGAAAPDTTNEPDLLQPEPAALNPAAPNVTVPNVEAPAIAGLAAPSVPAPPLPAELVVREFPAMLYSNAEGILLSRSRESGEWSVMPRRALVHDGDEIASPTPFQAELTVNGTTLVVNLFRGARVRLESGTGTDLLAMHIDRGRVSFHRPLDGNHPEPVSIGLSLREQKAKLILSEPGSLCGVEVEQRAPQGRRPDPLLLVPEGGIQVISGSVSLAWNGGPAVGIGSDVGWAAWPVPPHPLEVGPQRPIPNWLTPEGIPQTHADKKLVQMYEKEFNIDQPVSMSIPALVPDRREVISAYATYTLGLVDDIPMLVKALQSEHEKTRQAAIWSLRSWLPSDPNNTAQLEQEVARIFPEEVVTNVVELLWGYSRDDAKDPIISQKLVALMDHKQIAIRELAFFHVSQLTPRTSAHGYRTSLADSPRNAALTGWRNMLEKNGGQLVK